MLNGIGYLSGGYFQRVSGSSIFVCFDSEKDIDWCLYGIRWRAGCEQYGELGSLEGILLIDRVVQLVAANIEREVTWIIQFRAQMARFWSLDRLGRWDVYAYIAGWSRVYSITTFPASIIHYVLFSLEPFRRKIKESSENVRDNTTSRSENEMWVETTGQSYQSGCYIWKVSN